MTRERVTRATMGYCTVIGNAYFTYFRTTERKSRQSFFRDVARVSLPAMCSMSNAHAVSPNRVRWRRSIGRYSAFRAKCLAQDSAQWQTVLTALGIVRPQAVRRVTEAALLGGVIEQGGGMSVW